MLNQPIIRLELQYIKENICHMISDHNKEINEAVINEIGRAIDNIDIKTMVETGVSDCIQSAISEYFKFGDGRKSITQAVFDSLDTVMCDLSAKGDIE